MLARSYLRASTDEEDATRARAQVEAFAAEHGLTIAATYVENGSGAKLALPELFRLLTDSKPGDVLLIEQVDRLSRWFSGLGASSSNGSIRGFGRSRSLPRRKT